MTTATSKKPVRSSLVSEPRVKKMITRAARDANKLHYELTNMAAKIAKITARLSTTRLAA